MNKQLFDDLAHLEEILESVKTTSITYLSKFGRPPWLFYNPPRS